MRLLGTAVIPLHEPDWSVAELERVAKNGLRAALINTVAPKGCPPLRDASYEPFWSAAENLDMPVLIHIVTGRVQDPIVYSITPEHLLKHPRASTRCGKRYRPRCRMSSSSVASSIHPKLKLMDAEYDISWLLYSCFATTRFHEQFRGILDLPKLKMKPSDYLKTRIWHGMTDDPFGVDTIRRVGADCILWGSDFRTCVRLTTIPRRRSPTSTANCRWRIKRKVVGENVASLFGL